MDKADSAATTRAAGRWPGRRGVLRAGLAAGALAGAGAWRMAPGWQGPPAQGLRAPGSLPYPSLPAGTDTISRIEHIVVLMMENHSYDNRLGMLRRRGANGFRLGRDGLPTAANPYANGDIQHAFRMPTTCQVSTVTQEWGNSHIQYDNGKKDYYTEPGGAELQHSVRREPAEHRRGRGLRGERYQRGHQRSGQSAYDGFARYGFRVPFALVSPWARRHHVSHVVYDHTSILKLVETKWNLPALTFRDTNARAPLDMLDLRRPSFAEPPRPPARSLVPAGADGRGLTASADGDIRCGPGCRHG